MYISHTQLPLVHHTLYIVQFSVNTRRLSKHIHSYNLAIGGDSLTCTMTLPHVLRCSIAMSPSAVRSSGNVSG